jgi:hypothetical protein
MRFGCPTCQESIDKITRTYVGTGRRLSARAGIDSPGYRFVYIVIVSKCLGAASKLHEMR